MHCGNRCNASDIYCRYKKSIFFQQARFSVPIIHTKWYIMQSLMKHIYCSKLGGKLMKEKIIGRRGFLGYAAAVAAGTGLLGESGFAKSSQKGAKLRKALQLRMLPRKLSDADKFKLAKKCGFDGIEATPMDDLDAARRLGRLGVCPSN
jgi:hypothetical protein